MQGAGVDGFSTPVSLLSAGIVADTLRTSWAIGSVRVLTLRSGAVVGMPLKEKEGL